MIGSSSSRSKKSSTTECLTASGFFLNLPNIIQHVNLTAAHNLISNGIRTFNLKVYYKNIDPNHPGKVIFMKPAIIEISVDNTDQSDNIQSSAEIRDYYMGTLWNYAVICFPRTSGDTRDFGFSLKFAPKKIFNGTFLLAVSGNGDEDSRPFHLLRFQHDL